MNNKKKILIVFAIALAVCCGWSLYHAVITVAGNGISWHSYDAGIRVIKEQKKKGFLFFYGEGCSYCDLMHEKTFSDEKVVGYINHNFIPIQVNVEKQKDIARKYRIYSYPDTKFIAEDTSIIGDQPGFIPADRLLRMLAYIKSGCFQKMSFNDCIGQP